MSLLPAAQEHILAQDDGKKRFVKAVRDLSKAFALAVPHEETLRIRDDVAFFQAESRILLAGDLLFQGSIGRTDFPGGDHATLLRSIARKLFPLGDDVSVVPGHGPTTQIGQERRTNPFLQGLQEGSKTGSG